MAAVLLAQAAYADEFGVIAGGGRSREVGGLKLPYMVDYQQNLGRHAAIGVSYLNEGHATLSHRDGAALQIRGRMAIFDPRLILTVGAGPYAYFDTTRSAPDAQDTVDHGWGMLYSAGLTWELGSSWYLQGRIQRVEAHRSHDANYVMIGAGYRFGPPLTDVDHAVEAPNRDREIGLYGGRVIAHTFQSETATAKAIDYRRKVSDTYERSLTLLEEGDTGPVRRYGIAGQAWVVRQLGSERLKVSAGAGPYLLFKVRGEGDQSGNDRLAGLASASLAYDITPSLRLRFVFHRVFARHSRDADVLILGLSWVS